MKWTLLAALLLGCNGDDTAREQDPHMTDDLTGETETHADGRAHDEGLVSLSAEQMARIGIATEKAAPGTVETRLDLSAVVSANLDARAHVTPRVSGLVHRVHVGLGQRVSQGDVLCEIDSAELGRMVSAYITAGATVEMDTEILAGERAVLERNVALAQEILAREDQLAEEGMATLSARYAAETRLQDARLRRDSRLLELDARLARDKIQFVAAERELEILGVPHEALKEITAAADEAHAPLGRYAIRAPRDGVVVMRDVSDAEHVDTENTILGIQDLNTVWVMGSVYEQDLASVRIGASAEVTLDAYPGQTFAGQVAFIDPVISLTTRAASVRVVLQNTQLESRPEAYLVRPGMFGSIALTTGSIDAGIVLPESALVHDGPDGDFVFVEIEPGTFEQRPVRIGARTTDRVQIIAGVAVGESVASSGTFILKSAARADELGEGHEH